MMVNGGYVDVDSFDGENSDSVMENSNRCINNVKLTPIITAS